MATSADRELEQILAILRRQTSVDFTLYKRPTLRRRLQRRMVVHGFGQLGQYASYLRTHPAEGRILFEELLVQVTQFFRDPAIFETVTRVCLAPLCRKKDAKEPIRLWVPACASGEELYSYAIILTELLAGRKGARPVQLFGTDINETALHQARAGWFPSTIRDHVSPERLERFFEPASEGFKVRKALRELCVFARHNLTADPPFSNLDLISCRNLLIYFTPALQQQVVPLFHFALKPEGQLLLGPAESIGAFSHLFKIEDKSARLFRRKDAPTRSATFGFKPTGRPVPASSATGRAVKPPKPLPLHRLRSAVQKTLRQDVKIKGHDSTLVPLAIPGSSEKVYLVVTGPEGALDPAAPKSPSASNLREVRKLRRELLALRGTLARTTDQAEATNEELRAANEEIVSSNEELQSTNEELESAKEELQSANEELATVNAELELRNAALERANVVASHFQAIVASSDDAIISKDLAGIIQTWNHGAEKMYGYKADEVIGKSVAVLIPADRADEEPAILAQLAAGRSIDHYETVRRHKDGTLLSVSLSVSPIRNTAGLVIGAAKIARDITARKRADAEIRHARETAEKANRAKDNFLAALSHELRTPLTPILLMSADAAINPQLPAAIRADFETIRSNVEVEVRLIDDLLDLSRITAGKLRMEMRPVDVHQVVLSALGMIRDEIVRKDLDLVKKFTTAPSMVMGDSVRLHQIIWNLLRNAAKFTPPNGRITIEESVREGRVTIKVIDTGIGMDERELARAFDAFAQGNHAETGERSYGGLGLGLTISKRLAEYHAGTILAESAGHGAGSTFTLELPSFSASAAGAEEGAKPPAHLAPAARRILLVEDHPPTRAVLARLLSSRNYDVTAAASHAEAIAQAQRSEFDLVISDIGLPDGDGYSLFRELRTILPALRGIALTGFGMQEDRATSSDSGFQFHLTKPVQMAALERALAEI